MKKALLISLSSVIILSGCYSTVDKRRKIEVTGVAEQEVTPDIINVSITLKEYNNAGKKVTIDVLEKQLYDAAMAAGISKKDLTVNDVYSYRDTYQKKITPAFMASKTYGIRFDQLSKFNQIIGTIDAKGIESTNIVSYDYSKMPAAKKELNIKALQAAKTKATYLLNSVDEKLGKVISVEESSLAADHQGNSGTENVVVYGNQMRSDMQTQTVKLSFQVKAVFEIN